MLSVTEQRAWDAAQRFWADDGDEPPLARQATAVLRKPEPRRIDDAPAPLVGGLWVAIFLVLFGIRIIGLALVAVTMSSLLVWRYRPLLRRDDGRQRRPESSGDRPGTSPLRKRSEPVVAEVMCRRPATVDADTSLFRVWGRLHGKGGEHVVVIDEAGHPIGVVDERDVALEWPAGPLAPHHLPVRRLLRFRARPRVLYSDDVSTAARALLQASTDALPVVDGDGRLTGLITARHCVELVAAGRAGT